ncbi:MAG: galactokinase [Acidimicrobiales bacterium]
MDPVVAFAPGRVNLIGDHTDYSGGLAMPIATQLGTEVAYLPDPSSTMVELSSDQELEAARLPITIPPDPSELAMILPEWGRYVGGVVATLRPSQGGKGSIVSDLPLAAGLSSSASLQVALALAISESANTPSLASLCQRAEHLATGVATGILDQVAVTSALRGHAILLDCTSLETRQIPVPDGVEIVVVHCGVDRKVDRSPYAERQEQCALAERELGPLRDASPWEVDRISDLLIRRRARHVVSENARVRAFCGALEHDDLPQAGSLMNASHQSLSDDFEVSIRELDDLVSWLQVLDGVYGARLTGAGFGGCAVAIARPGVIGRRLGDRRHWIVRPSDGAHLR